jgi:hypothetical protein
MKLFVKLIFASLFIAVLLPFTFLKGTDGHPLMSIGDLKMPKIGLPEIAKDAKLPKLHKVGSANQDIVYQWRDAEGSLHFTSQPPPEGTEYTMKGYDPSTNLIQSVNLEEKSKTDQSASDTEQSNTSQVKSASDIGNPYSPEKVEKLFKDAKNIEKLLNDRMKQQEAMIGQ